MYLSLTAPRLLLPLRSYRGYGLSEGKPSQRGLMLDAEAALDFVLARQELSGRVVVFGRSLGGAVGVHLAARHQDKVRLEAQVYCA